MPKTRPVESLYLYKRYTVNTPLLHKVRHFVCNGQNLDDLGFSGQFWHQKSILQAIIGLGLVKLRCLGASVKNNSMVLQERTVSIVANEHVQHCVPTARLKA